MSYIIQKYDNIVYFTGPIAVPVMGVEFSLDDYVFDFSSQYVILNRHGVYNVEGHGTMLRSGVVATGTWEYVSSPRQTTSLRFFVERVPDEMSIAVVLLLVVTVFSAIQRRLGSIV